MYVRGEAKFLSDFIYGKFLIINLNVLPLPN